MGITNVFSGSGGASIALDNLKDVEINIALIPDTDLSRDFGNSVKAWKDL